MIVGKMRHAIFATLLILLLLPATVAADDYLGGIPLSTIQSGTVSGDLWVDAAPAPDWGSLNVTKTFSLPAAAVAQPDRIKWARLYVSVYCGHMQNNYRGRVSTFWNGNGDSTYEQQWSETLDTPYSYPFNGGTGPVLLNEHLNRVTSDYFMWYNVTNSISARNVSARVVTAPVDGSFDGRIKVITLVVAYDDGDTDVIHYWVNQGHDTCSYYYEDNFGEVGVGSTTFTTSGVGTVSSATLTAVYMASSNGYFGFPSTAYDQTNHIFAAPLSHGYTMQGPYAGYQSWNVTPSISGDTTLGFTRDLSGTGLGGFYKIPLAFLKVQSLPVTAAPVAVFTATPQSGPAPLPVRFTDQSTNTPASWKWEYRFRPEGGSAFGTFTPFATTQHPVFIFNNSGAYIIRLTATNAVGNSTMIEGSPSAPYITVTPSRPVAGFTATPQSGSSPLTVLFNDTSTGIITSYAWDFTNNGTVESTAKNTSFTYNSSGVYTVNHSVTGPAGSTSTTLEITVNDPGSGKTGRPSANFTADLTRGSAPLKVRFSDKSSGSIISWAWDFNSDGRNESADQNPTYIYPAEGVYSVTLTVSGPTSSDSIKKTDYIKVRGTPTCDLTIAGAVNPVASTVFAKEPNTIRVVNVKNNGPGSSPATAIQLRASDGFTIKEPLPALESGQNTTVSLTDATVRPSAGAVITYNITVDPDDDLAETNETNNIKQSSPKTVTYNGYKGKRYWSGGDITTRYVYDINGGLVHSFGDSVYRSGSFGGSGWTSYSVKWAPSDLIIPPNATIRQALLYVPYTWDNTNEIESVSLRFNGESTPKGSWYHDVSNFGVYSDHVYGLLTYDVTSSFKKNAQNTAMVSRGSASAKLSMYGFTLAAVYEDNETSRKKIFINEGFDLLGADSDGYGTTPEEATAYIPFSRMTIDPATVSRADLITYVASGDNEGMLLFNNESLGSSVWDYGSSSGPQVAVATRDVTGSLAKADNTAMVRSTEGETPAMAAMQQFLIVEYGTGAVNRTSLLLSANFTAEPLNGTAPLKVNFTDLSTGNPFNWAWDFENDGVIDNTTQNPQYTYRTSGNYSVVLTVKNATASHSVNKTGYIVVSNATVVTNGTTQPVVADPTSTVSYLKAPPEDTISQDPAASGVSVDATPAQEKSGDIIGTIVTAVKWLVDNFTDGLSVLRDRLPFLRSGGQGL